VHIQALYSADGILLGSSSKLRLLVINLASVTARQLVNSPNAQSLGRQTVKKPKKSYENRLNDNHSPIGVLDNSKNDLVFSQSVVSSHV
jgi:hypothetical protein